MEAGLTSWSKTNCSQEKPFHRHEQVLAMDGETLVWRCSVTPLSMSCWAPHTSAGAGAGIDPNFTLFKAWDNVKLCIRQETTQTGGGKLLGDTGKVLGLMPPRVQNHCSQVTWGTINSLILLARRNFVKPYIVSQWQNRKVSVVACSVTERLLSLQTAFCTHNWDCHTQKEWGRGKKNRKTHLRSYVCLMLKSLNAQTIIYHYRSTGGQYNALELCTMTQFSIKIFLQCRILRNC